MISAVLKTGDRVEIKSLQKDAADNDKQFPAVSRLAEIVDENTIVTEEFRKEDNTFVPEPGDRYEYRFISSTGSYVSRIEIIDSFIRGDHGTAEARILSDLTKDMKRKFYRLDKIMPVKFSIKGDKEDGNNTELYNGTVSNLSAGGLKFSSSEELVRDDEIEVHIFLEDYTDEPYVLKARVIYSDIVANRNMNYEHRAQFVDMNLEVREKIVKYVFKEARKQYTFA